MNYQIEKPMTLFQKLEILADAAKYDVACTSSGVDRRNDGQGIGNCIKAGICHSFSADGRCISLLKILMTNECIYDCKYCINRRSNDVPRTTFTPQEICDLTIGFYRRNYIEGLFLSSGIVVSPDVTMELLYQTLYKLRTEYHFQGYIHVKAIPGASPELIEKTGYLADRMSVNLELPTAEGLKVLAPQKKRERMLAPIQQVQTMRRSNKEELILYRHAPKFVPAGQSTQMIIGATGESDYQIMKVAEHMYQKYDMKRVFFSAFVRVSAEKPDFNLLLDPKCDWALRHLDQFPVEVMKADYDTLLRVPGIGYKSAQRIVKARRLGSLDYGMLKKMGVVLKRAIYFITCQGKQMYPVKLQEDFILRNILDGKEKLPMGLTGEPEFRQLSLFDDPRFSV